MQFIMYATDPKPGADQAPPSPELMTKMAKMIEDSKKAGVLITTGSIGPKSTRIRSAGGKYTVTDGPYIEAKELMGGFAIFEVKTLEEAIAWAKRFRDIVGDGESEIVPIMGPEDFAGA